MVSSILLPILQIVVIAGLSPLVKGFINKMEARIQCRRGPSLFQPYYNLVKLLQKDAVVSETASWIFRATPYVVFYLNLTYSVAGTGAIITGAAQFHRRHYPNHIPVCIRKIFPGIIFP